MPSNRGIYKGKAARVVRVWGRRRLSALRRFLPFVERVDVSLLGSGLPSFWIARAGAFSITLGLTGFTSGQLVAGGQLRPAAAPQDPDQPAAGGGARAPQLVLVGAGAGELARATGLAWPALLEALQLGCQQGKLMHDLASDVYRLRTADRGPPRPRQPGVPQPVRADRHDLLVRRGAVRSPPRTGFPGSGLELTGKVVVDEDRREYRPQLLLADEGHVSRAECTCPPTASRA